MKESAGKMHGLPKRVTQTQKKYAKFRFFFLPVNVLLFVLSATSEKPFFTHASLSGTFRNKAIGVTQVPHSAHYTRHAKHYLVAWNL